MMKLERWTLKNQFFGENLKSFWKFVSLDHTTFVKTFFYKNHFSSN